MSTSGASVAKPQRHLYAVAAAPMRRVLLDHARRHRAQRRGAGTPVSLWEGRPGKAGRWRIEALGVDEAIAQREALDAVQAKIMELALLRDPDGRGGRRSDGPVACHREPQWCHGPGLACARERRDPPVTSKRRRSPDQPLAEPTEHWRPQ